MMVYGKTVLALLSAACAKTTLSAHSYPTSISPRQADGAVNASVFLRRAYHSSVVLNRRLYIDGGEFSYSNGSGITHQYLNSLLSIDLTEDWTNSSVALHSSPKPAEAPNVTHGGIWVDRKTGVFYTGFAGTHPDFGDAATSPQGLWAFTPDGSGAGSWANLNQSADSYFTSQPRPFRGQVASGRGFGFYLGGWVQTGVGVQRPLGSFVAYDFVTSKVNSSNILSPSTRAWSEYGGMTYVPNFGDRGVLILVGGYNQDSTGRADVNGPASFGTVHVYDLASQRWFDQKTTGDIPMPRKEFCIAGAPSKQRTYEILVYGGWDGNLGAGAIPYDSAFVLTLPGFYWIKADYPPLHPRHGHTCNAVGGSQILVLGGVDSTQQQGVNGSDTGVFDTPDPFTQGLAIFDLGQLTWSAAYAANRRMQAPALQVQKYYSAQGRKPAEGFGSPDLEKVFSIEDFSRPDEGASTSAASHSQRNHTGAVVGGVFGGIAAVALTAALVLCVRRRRGERRAGLRSEKRSDAGAGPAACDDTALAGGLESPTEPFELSPESVARGPHELPADHRQPTELP
ncbi:hypothetical protein VTK56DRAFT_7111 [Thermocarpiscus australiensis]